MPKSSLIVLISAKKVADKAVIFNFEAVFKKYNDHMKNHALASLQMSKQVFLKIFLDLVDKGFLKSENETDILSVNNKVAFGFRIKDFEALLRKSLDKLDLSTVMKTWALSA